MYYATDDAGFYSTVRLGRTQSLTPEGYLIIRDVPVARLGEMVYAAKELPWLVPGRDGTIRVQVTDQVLFHPDTLASFNGKPIADGHPEDLVGPENIREHSVGNMLNPRRGEGNDSDKFLADLLVTHAEGIKALRERGPDGQEIGLREVSLGYDADYEQSEPGRAVRTKMVGNHVAINVHGRCGPACAIGDNAMKHSLMTSAAAFKGAILTAFAAKDEKALAKALDEMPAAIEDPDKPSGHHVVVNVNAAKSGGADAAEPDKGDDPDKEKPAPFEKKVTDSLDKISAKLDATDKRLDAIDAWRVAKDAKEDDPDKDKPLVVKGDAEAPVDPKGEPNTKTGEPEPKNSKTTNSRAVDAKSVAAEAQDVKTRAEVLLPGVQFPAFDAKGGAKTLDALCGFRRKVLSHDKCVYQLPKGMDIAKMTCDAVAAVFTLASDTAMAKNDDNSKKGTLKVGDRAQLSSQIEEINKRNREFWNPAKKA